ncbi:MAG: zinc ribbon domain-containing protein [Eubacteriales bacterium]|nr:zinc ribbon domain-containing protein [Eubacteriales bacterium]
MADLLQKQMEAEQRELDELYLSLGKRCFAVAGIAGIDAQLDRDIEAVNAYQRSMELGKRCTGCLALLKEGAQFCPKCGQRVEIQVVCNACGAVMKEGAKFCAKCGNTVGGDSPTVPVAPRANVCRACGSALKEGAIFCGSCGTKQ